ncbi:GntR family transcriptional regulator [Frondihabitans australicus]|uniref:DNA-binding GntR family transcriptional regulator n=1 Tax=Frondihabitans australicus TaxID=386892 RepID=A0A495ILA3_9MICO|nr:GntR family transcriptional regulator [Frondihabitans australicus]RKR76500.1 DNA-binding GntR family transcriptional regulator [Frondihabitans australicus]
MPVPVTSDAKETRLLLRDRVRGQIQEAILDGTLLAGERLNDDELVAWLGVSRTPIREALVDLEHMGLVVIEPNRFTAVADPDPAMVVPILQTLGVLYGGVLRLAVPLLTKAEAKRLAAQVDSCVEALDEGDFLSVNVHTVALFDAFVGLCGNAPLIKATRDIEFGLAYRLRVPNIVDLLPWGEMRQQYLELKAATLAGDGIAAELAGEALHQLPVTPRG